MADYVLPSVVEKRVRYFDGQFLQDQDFIDEQDYQLDREHRHNRLLHGPGITEGLAVTSAAPNQVTVAPGTAIDSDGRQLVLAQATTVDLPAAEFNDKQGVEILLSYLESAEDPQTVGGSRDFTRWLERPALTALAPGDTYSGTAPPVLLANVALDHSGRVAVDSTVRTYAGLVLPGAGADAVTLRATSGGPVELAGSLTIDGSLGIGTPPAHPLHLAVGKELRIEGGTGNAPAFSFGGTGAFSIDAPNVPGGRFVVQNNGNVGVGTANPTARLEVAGGGGTSVDLVVNGRLRSANPDGGLWVASDRFVGGFDGNKIGFWTNNAWQLAVLPNGNVGIGTTNPGFALHLPQGKALRIEGATGPAAAFSLGGQGAFSIDAPGVFGGRFVVQDNGSVGVGTSKPTARLEVAGGGGTSVDLVVNGRLRSANPDGGLWVASDRFVGGFDGNKIGFWNGNAWQLAVLPNGNVGIGTTNPTARLEVAGGGGTSVDLVVNGRLRSNNNDGGLWVASDRFVGGFDTNKIGFWNGNAWQLAVLSNGNVGIGTTSPAYPLHLPGGKALRIDAGTSGTDGTAYFSFGGNGDFSIDAPGVPGGRFLVQNSGNVGIGTNGPPFRLTVSNDDAHLQLRREANAAAGTKIYLELFQDNSPSAVYPCIRFHHSNVFWHRIQGQPEGLSFRTGNPGDNTLVNVIANTAVLNSITIGNITIGQNELAILQKLAQGTLQFDLLNTSHNEYAYAASDGFNYDGDRRRIFCWIPNGERVTQGRWQIAWPG